MIKKLDRTGIKYFILIFTVLLSSCAAFSYKHYFLRSATYDGKLIADKVENDLQFSKCLPTDIDQNPCIVMFREEFYRLKADHVECIRRVDELERYRP